jgi:hypothetical protein
MNDNTPKAQAAQILRDAPTASFQTGGTLNVYVGNDAISKMPADIRTALNRGDCVTFDDGSKQYIDTNKIGSAQYTWDKTDTRVKHDRVLVTIDADGNRTDKKLSSVYRAF